MDLVAETIALDALRDMAQATFGDFVKGVVDLSQGLLVVDAELHADQEAFLLERGSRQEDLWGVNLYPDLPEEHWVEFDSMINIRPSQGNRSREVEDPATRTRILELVARRVVR